MKSWVCVAHIKSKREDTILDNSRGGYATIVIHDYKRLISRRIKGVLAPLGLVLVEVDSVQEYSRLVYGRLLRQEREARLRGEVVIYSIDTY